VFGRGKSEQVDAGQQSDAAPEGTGPQEDATERTQPSGKGRPTPKRREAEARNRHPLIAKPLDRTASREERKQRRAEERLASRQRRSQLQQAYITGEDRYLPARDKGPVKRWVRDYVDARRSIGEYFLPIALPLVLCYAVPNPFVQLAAIALLYALLALVATDSLLLRRRLNRLVVARFPGEETRGAGTYGMFRSWQIRRSRLPRPQVARGGFPT